ncbi:hypothetical protein BMETH_169_1 [methanotrophic bacterial endosymbiont of Bathymodiolus sp.]|nr:hypothetical protein BMETH_169_1 [methanotrophic bacterial endosymbiont of Bathymodiolus sp.]
MYTSPATRSRNRSLFPSTSIKTLPPRIPSIKPCTDNSFM